ncbi:amidinotransferase [Candidatus Uhrbacteria bacterium]|nr:amidinotransferase [Candidatus Uhrbacteria bacterium]
MPEKFFMCRPTYFDVVYEINPWMDVQNKPDKELAVKQWERLRQTYLDLGAIVEEVEPLPDLPDMVFTANAGLVFEKKFIPSRFKFQERQGEEPAFIRWFAEHGYEIVELPQGMTFEGEADRILRHGKILVANGFRTDATVPYEVGRLLGVDILRIKLVNPKFYHLDTCLAYFEDGDTVLYYPGAFDEESREKIKKEFPRVIEAEDDEADRYVCNSINVGQTIVMNQGCPKAQAELEKCGYKVVTLDMSEFLKSGGSIKCLTLKLGK